MAPALSDTSRKHLVDGDLHPRRVLTSVGNLSPMDDEMGLQNAANLSKESQDMEQMLVELGGADIAQADLLQAIKTLEGGSDGLSASDADAIFPLSSFEREDMLETGDSESDFAEDKIRVMQAKLERRSSFLLRRMRMHQARAIGKRVSEETAQTIERSGRVMRRDVGSTRPSIKSILKRIETTAALQCSSGNKSRPGPSYYQVGQDSSLPSATLGIAPGALEGSVNIAGALRSHLRVVEQHLDSDATASSSGAESNDEATPYTNLNQQSLPIEERALWRWQRRRASLASRWAWLQAQVQELEYKIRQHSELHAQVREAKGAVELEGSPVGYEGQLPGGETCARVRPLKRQTFRKRKLLLMQNLHLASAKAAKPADIRCGCQPPLAGCGVCTGREVCTQPLPPHSTLSRSQNLALLLPDYHPVLSDIHDVPPNTHLSALCSQPWWSSKARTARNPRQVLPSTTHTNTTTTNTNTQGAKKRKYNKVKKNRTSVGRKSRDTEEVLPPEKAEKESRAGRPPNESRRNNSSSYDIDNIVIPPCVAATTRLEILHYKEIPTPKWRVLDVPRPVLNNGHTHGLDVDIESDEEDISEASVLARHTRAEQTERGKYARKKRTRRSNHQNSTESQTAIEGNGPAGSVLSGGEESNQSLEPHAETNGHADSHRRANTPHETVRPYSPRVFPLEERTYREMLLEMPPDHPLSVSELAARDALPEDGDADSPLSLLYDGDDPNDPEWQQEKDDER